MTLLLAPSTECAQRDTEAFTALRRAHLAAANVVSEIDLDDAASWAAADPVVTRITTSAYAMTAALTDRPTPKAATTVPPIVRIRELSAAQLHLFAALDTHRPDAITRELAEASTHDVCQLGRLLIHPA
jgi:hypothetical protein